MYHETVPGHHFQIALELENTRTRRSVRSVRSAASRRSAKGGAFTPSGLQQRAGWYENDLEGLLGQLEAALFRARRLVVDTGIHAKGWTRQQAIDYGIEASEIERYVVTPARRART